MTEKHRCRFGVGRKEREGGEINERRIETGSHLNSHLAASVRRPCGQRPGLLRRPCGRRRPGLLRPAASCVRAAAGVPGSCDAMCCGRRRRCGVLGSCDVLRPAASCVRAGCGEAAVAHGAGEGRARGGGGGGVGRRRAADLVGGGWGAGCSGGCARAAACRVGASVR